MAYIGVAVLEGTKMWADRRRTEEADRRLKAERQMWDMTNDANTALAAARNAEVQKASNMQQALAQNSGKILAGGAEGAKGVASVMNAQLGTQSGYEYRGTAEGKVQLVDKKTNKVVQESDAPSGKDAVIALRGMSQDLTSQYQAAQALAAEARKNEFELNKMAKEYGYKYNQSEMEKRYDLTGTKYKADRGLQGTIGSANIRANADRDVANIGANKDITTTYLREAENLQRVGAANALSLAMGRPTTIDKSTGSIVDATSGMPVVVTDQNMLQNVADKQANIMTSAGLNAFAPYPYIIQDAATKGQQIQDVASMVTGIPTVAALDNPLFSATPTSTFANTGLVNWAPAGVTMNNIALANRAAAAIPVVTGQPAGLADLITQYGTGY